MEKNKEESKCLASLAVFRELYNKQKDVYGVISAFLNEIISSNGIKQFNITEVTNLLNSTFDFSIPEAVIRTSLGRLDYLEKEQGVYTVVKPINSVNGEVSTLQKEIIQNNDIIIENLFDFIQTEKKTLLNEAEKKKIEHSFCSFLLDNANGEYYAEFISAFFVENNNDLGFRKKINTIREGVVLYSGLKYNNNLNDLGSWKTEFTIYLDTEILFHFAGYNGEIYKTTNMENKLMVEKYKDPEVRKQAEKKIEGELKQFEENLWVTNDSITDTESKSKSKNVKNSKVSKPKGGSSSVTYSAKDRR